MASEIYKSTYEQTNLHTHTRKEKRKRKQGKWEKAKWDCTHQVEMWNFTLFEPFAGEYDSLCDPINSIKYVVFIDYKHLLCALLKNTNGFTSSPSTYLDVSSVSESVHQIDPVCECQCLQMSQPNVVVRLYICACVRVCVCAWMEIHVANGYDDTASDIALVPAHQKKKREKKSYPPNEKNNSNNSNTEWQKQWMRCHWI